MRSARPTLAALVALTALVASCNEHPLAPLGETLTVINLDYSPELKSNAVDILWVVDNSPSMREEQVELGQRFEEFILAQADLQADFRMAVITTDVDDRGIFRTEPGDVQSLNCLEPPASLSYCEDLELGDDSFISGEDYLLVRGDPSQGFDTDALARDFRCIASAGDCGSGFERGLEMLRDGLQDASNAGFVRDEAFLLVIFLSDEDDCSNDDAFNITRDADCYAAEQRDQLVPTGEFYDFLVDLKNGQEEKILLAGIIGPDDGQPPQTFVELERDGPRFSCISELSTSDTAVDARDGERYRELIEAVGSRGVEESICQGSFSAALTNIAEILRDALDVNCLQSEPRSCEFEEDCPSDQACVDPGQPGGPRFCETFEIIVEIRESDQLEFEPLASPGTAGEEPAADAQFYVDYDADVCVHGVAFSFAPGSRPPTGSRYRVAYPRATEIISAGVDDEAVGGETSAE